MIIQLIVAFLAGGMVGFMGMAILAARAYDKGYEDAKKECVERE
jgi:hypothetical protein